METVKVGQLAPDSAMRDAIHVAVAPVIAAHTFDPSDKVALINGEAWHAGETNTVVGIVDPFLTEQVQPGQRFWLFLLPGTTTSLRHVWTHPAFKPGVLDARRIS